MLERRIEAAYDRDRAIALRAANLGLEKLRHLLRLVFDPGPIDGAAMNTRASLTGLAQIGVWRKHNEAPANDGRFDAIANIQALRRAVVRAAKGKRRKADAAPFLADLERELLRVERTLRDGSYRPGAYLKVEVFDPSIASCGRRHFEFAWCATRCATGSCRHSTWAYRNSLAASEAHTRIEPWEAHAAPVPTSGTPLLGPRGLTGRRKPR